MDAANLAEFVRTRSLDTLVIAAIGDASGWRSISARRGDHAAGQQQANPDGDDTRGQGSQA